MKAHYADIGIVNMIRQRLKAIGLQRWFSEINNDTRKDANQSNKMRTYRLFKTIDNYRCEDYLHQVTNTRYRIALTKLRLSTNFLLPPPPTPLRWRSINPPRFIFYHARSTDFEEKIEGLWTGYYRARELLGWNSLFLRGLFVLRVGRLGRGINESARGTVGKGIYYCYFYWNT